MQPVEYLIEGFKPGLSGEDLIKAPIKLRFFLLRGRCFVLLQVRIEVPDLSSDRLVIVAVMLVERNELVNEAFRMHPA